MSQLLDGFDPSASPTGGTFNTKLGATPGTLILFNLSPFELALNFNGVQQALPAWLARRIDIVYPCPNATWAIKQALGQLNSPISLVWGEAYSVSEAAAITEVYPQVLSRVTNIGNNLVASANTPANEFEQDFFNAGWVLTGLVGTKDGVTVNQLDVTAGVAFVKQSDSGWGRVAPNATTYLTSTPSTTYFLDLNPDGTFSFATSHSLVSNHITICSLTTDGSGNILAVTDARTLNSTMLSAMLGALAVPPLLVKRGGLGVMGTLVAGDVLDVDSTGNLFIKVPAGKGISLQSPNGSTQTQFGGAALGIQFLNGQATAGNFGVPVIVAQTLWQAVTTTGLQAVLTTGTLPEGLYRINAYIAYSQAAAQALVLRVEWTSKVSSGIISNFLSVNAPNNTPSLLNGVNTFSGPVEFALMPIDIYIKASTAITVKYNDPSGTPADNVTVVIERLA